MSGSSKAVIVVPAYNETTSIAEVVDSLRVIAPVVVVDDGSSDNTAEQAEKAGAKIVPHEVNRGYDAALSSGISYASHLGADAVVTFDADGQLNADSVQVALNALLDGNIELVLGVRDGGGARVSEILFNAYARLRFGAPDILCGLKGLRMRAVVRHWACLERKSANTALALALLREGVPFLTVPVKVRPREGQSRFGGAWRANIRIARSLGCALMDDLLRR